MHKFFGTLTLVHCCQVSPCVHVSVFVSEIMSCIKDPCPSLDKKDLNGQCYRISYHIRMGNNLSKEGDVLKTEKRIKGCLCVLPVLFPFGHGKSVGLKLT